MHCPTKDTPRPQRDAQDTPSHTPCSPRATSSCTQSDTRTLILATSSCTHAALPGTTTHCSTPDTLLRTPPDQLTSHRTLLDVGTSSAHAALWRTLPTLHTFLTPLTAAARNFLVHTLLYRRPLSSTGYSTQEIFCCTVFSVDTSTLHTALCATLPTKIVPPLH